MRLNLLLALLSRLAPGANQIHLPFLTTEPNAIVAPIHAKAMPVILTTQEEVDLWMTAPGKDALTLQRPLPDNALRIVARGQKQDGLPDDRRLGLAGA